MDQALSQLLHAVQERDAIMEVRQHIDDERHARFMVVFRSSGNPNTDGNFIRIDRLLNQLNVVLDASEARVAAAHALIVELAATSPQKHTPNDDAIFAIPKHKFNDDEPDLNLKRPI